MQDLKAGYILGATPWRQQVVQGVGVISAVLVMAPILTLLLKAYGIGVPTEETPNALLAPQATLMASVAKGVFHGGLPWNMVAIGVIIGTIIIIIDEILKAKGATFRAPVLAVAVGIYLPLELSVPIFFGGLVAHFAERFHKKHNSGAHGEHRLRLGMLFAAGLITGEALIGIFMAIPIVASGRADVLAAPEALRMGSIVGLIVVLGLAFVMYKLAATRKTIADACAGRAQPDRPVASSATLRYAVSIDLAQRRAGT